MNNSHLDDLIRLQRGETGYQRKNTTDSGTGVAAVFLMLGVFFGIPAYGVFGVIWTLVALFALLYAMGKNKKRQQEAAKKAATRPAAPQPKVAAAATARPAPCTNPEPHRHFEAPKTQEKPCTNMEEHRHFEREANVAEYDRRSLIRRRESLESLHEAGLLTREEYQHELRRLRK